MKDIDKSKLCIECQYCCKILSFTVAASGEGLSFYRARKVRVRLLADRPTMIISIPCICPHLTSKGCDIYKDRPNSCKVFDGRYHESTKDYCLWDKGDKK